MDQVFVIHLTNEEKILTATLITNKRVYVAAVTVSRFNAKPSSSVCFT